MSTHRKIIQQEKRRVWNANYNRWIATDPNFASKYELCYSYTLKGIPHGWFLKKKNINTDYDM